MFGASQVTEYSCGATANHLIEKWFGDCIYTTWDTVAFCIGLSSVFFWIFAQLPQFISNFLRSAADALSPWFLAQWLAGDTFNFLGCVLTGDQLKTQTITAGYFIFSDIVIITQYLYYQIRNKNTVDFDESTHKGSAYSDVLKSDATKDSSRDFESSDGSCSQQTPSAVSDWEQQDSWMYEHRHRLKRLVQEYGLEYGHATAMRLTSLYNIKRKEKYNIAHSRSSKRAHETLAVLKKPRYKAVLGIAGLFGLVSTTKLQRFSSVSKVGGLTLGRRSLMALHDAGAIPTNKSVYFVGQLLLLSQHAYPWTAVIGRCFGWGSSALYLGSRLSQLIKNKQRRTADGLSLGMVICAVLANLTYGTSIVMRGPSWNNLVGKAPWLAGSFGTVFLDFSILIQANYYNWHQKKGVPNEYTPLLA